MRIFALKPCSFGGRKFFVGDEIPESLIADWKSQVTYGNISVLENEDPGASPECRTIQIHPIIDGKASAVDITDDQADRAIKIMQADVKASVELVGGELDKEALLLVKALDSRKMVQEAVKKQMAILEDLTDDSTSPDDNNE